MKNLIVIFIILRCYVSTESVEDNYWRDFQGLIPNDAIPNDQKSDDKTYIGQFSVVAEYNTDVGNIHTVIATLHRGKKRAVASYNGRTVYSNETSNLKILCSSNSNYRYSWNSKTSLYSPNCRFVIGGFEDSVPLFIGRALNGKEYVTGKVFSDTTFHDDQLSVPYQGGEKNLIRMKF